MSPLLNRSSFNGMNSHLLKAPFASLTSSGIARKVMATAYLPGQPRFVGDQINIWCAGALKPKVGPHPAIDELISLLFPESKEREHVMRVLAFHIQRPSKKIRHALMVRGPQGSGKNTLFCDILGSLVGPRNLRTIGGEALGSHFNNDLTDVEVLVIDEVCHADGWETATRLKPLMSQDEILAEPKGEKRRLAKTPKMIVILTNETTPIPLDADDRRFFVSAFGSGRPPAAFFDALHAALPQELPGFLAALLAYDISQLDPAAHPPETDAKRELQAAVRPPIERQLKTWLEEHTAPFDRDIILSGVVLSRLKDAGYSSNEGAVSKALKALGCNSLGQLPERSDWSGRPRCWAVRDITRWKDASPLEWAAHLLKSLTDPEPPHTQRESEGIRPMSMSKIVSQEFR